MNPEIIKLDGITLTISEDLGNVFVNVQKGVFSFLEVMSPEDADRVVFALDQATAKAYAERRTIEAAKAIAARRNEGGAA
jgi:hypothetical protein